MAEAPAGAKNQNVRGHGFMSGGMLRNPAMSEFLSYALVPIAIAAVAVVLLLGLANMMRGGSPQRSQKLMRLRVLLQFVAIIVIMLAIWATGR
jgi:Hypoxia induced protein conserved region